MRGGVPLFCSSVLLAWATWESGPSPPQPPPGRATRLGQTRGGGESSGAGPLPPRSVEQQATAAGGLPQSSTPQEDYLPPPWDTAPQAEGQGWGQQQGAATQNTTAAQTAHRQDRWGGTTDTQVPGAPNSYNAIAAATGSREIPLNVKPIPGMTMVEHYLWVTTGQIPPSYVTRELLDPDSPHNTEDQGEATSSQAGTSTQQQHGQPRRRGGATRTRQHNRKHEGGGEARTRNKAEKYRIKRWLKAKGLHHTRWGEDWQTAASEKANPTKGTSNHRYPARDRGEEDWKRLLNPWDYPPPSSAQPTGKAANYHQHWHPDQTPEPRGEAKPQQPQQQPHTDTRDKASNYHPHWQPQDAHPGGVHSSQQPKPNPRGEHSSSNNPPTSAGDTVEPLGVSLPIQAAPAFSGETWLMLEPVTQRQWIATVTQTPPAHLQEGGTVAALVGDQFIFTRTRETWMIQYTVLTPDVFVNPAPPVPPQPATAGEDGTSAQDQATAAASSEPPRATTGPLHHASASSSTAAHQPLPDHPGGGRGLYDGRPLRGKPPRGTTMPTPQPAPWYDTVRDGRNIGRPKPTPQPAPTPEAEQVELMQRARPGTGGAASSHEPPPHNRDNDLLRQLQTIHEAAAAIPGGGVLTSMLDVAAQIVLASPTPAAPTTATSSTPERRSRKRPLGDPNAVAEVILYCRTAANSGGSLTAMDRAEDLFFVIGMVERGALQLLEPLPGDVSLSMLQGATQRLPHAVHMLIGARDQALQGHLQWHRPAFWEEIEQLVTPANSLVERRGDAFCEDGLPEVVHPADTIGLSVGGGRGSSPYQNGEQYSPSAERRRGGLQAHRSLLGGGTIDSSLSVTSRPGAMAPVSVWGTDRCSRWDPDGGDGLGNSSYVDSRGRSGGSRASSRVLCSGRNPPNGGNSGHWTSRHVAWLERNHRESSQPALGKPRNKSVRLGGGTDTACYSHSGRRRHRGVARGTLPFSGGRC